MRDSPTCGRGCIIRQLEKRSATQKGRGPFFLPWHIWRSPTKEVPIYISSAVQGCTKRVFPGFAFSCLQQAQERNYSLHIHRTWEAYFSPDLLSDSHVGKLFAKFQRSACFLKVPHACSQDTHACNSLLNTERRSGWCKIFTDIG